MNTFRLLTTASLAVILMVTACQKEDDGYDIPGTYNFDNVSYSGQTQRLAMLLEMKNYMTKANTSGVAIDQATLQAMYENNAAEANWTGTYEASKQLKNKTFEAYQSTFEGLISDLSSSSQSTEVGSEGKAGVVESQDGSKAYLLNASGVEEAQLIEKGLMGACFYWQATAVYMGEEKMDVDNETVEPGKGTAMEHHWDEAFGYLGVPVDFPANKDGVVFWGDYAADREEVLGNNQALMNAMIRGRAAISNNDLKGRDDAITDARVEWEKVVAGTALHYLNSAIDNYDDMALRAHALSEAAAFTFSLLFNPDRSLTTQQVNELLILIGGSDDLRQLNLYQVPKVHVETAKSNLAGYFGFGDMANEF